MRVRRPSMADVARSAGVSSQTVSRVSNGRPEVDAATRSKVQAAMDRLGYRPNRAARALKAGRFHTIGVVTTYLASFGVVNTLEAILTSADAAGYAVTLIPVATADAETTGAVTGALDRLREQAVDGIIVTIEPHVLRESNVVLPAGLPVVVANSGLGDSFAVVDSDQAGGARLATQHLLVQGHHSVWHLGGPPESVTAQAREHGWATTLADAGITAPPAVYGDWSAASGYHASAALAADTDVTAIFAANDQMALGCLRALREHGREVPTDVSVVGFDDTPEAPYAYPALTTISQNFARVGRECVAELLAEMEHPDTPRTATFIPTRLVVRSSTAAPPPMNESAC